MFGPTRGFSGAENPNSYYAGNLVSQGGSGTYGVGRIRRRGRVPDGLPDRSPEFAHRLVKLEKKTRPGERMGASTPSGLGARSGAPSQVPRHVAANGPAGPGPAPVAHGAPSPTPQAPGPSPSL